MAEEFKDQQFVDYVVRAIVNHPDDVRTERIIDDRGVLISLHTHPEDMGYVIGRSGQTARSIRTLLRIVGAKSDERVTLKIIEPEGSTHVRREDREAASASSDAETAEDDSEEEVGEAEEVAKVSDDYDDIDTSSVDDLTI
ncbi:KH domain-containing protein [Candidatus Uhrbacteria bacterium]|nr:KH domain-containing protein [Candidatus Uhrbacteria bacterium]